MSVVKILSLDGLSDAKLSELIEKLLSAMPGVDSAQINYLSQKLTLEISSKDTEQTIRAVVEMLKKVDPKISVKKTDVGKSAPASPPPRPKGAAAEYPREAMRSSIETMRQTAQAEPEQPAPRKEEKKKAKAKSSSNIQKSLRENTDLLLGGLCFIISLASFVVSLILPEEGFAAGLFLVISWLVPAFILIVLAAVKRELPFVITAVFSVAAGALLFFVLDEPLVAATALMLTLAASVAVLWRRKYFRLNAERILDMLPQECILKTVDATEKAAAGDVKPGDRVLVKEGEIIPVDGKVTDGTAELDTSMLPNGEPSLKVKRDDEVQAGSINTEGTITVQALSQRSGTVAWKICAMVRSGFSEETEQQKKAKKTVTIFTLVLLAAAGIAALCASNSIPGGPYLDTYIPAVSLLILACPCGMAASVKDTYLAALAGSVKQRIYFRGIQCLQAAAQVKTALMGYAGVFTKCRYKMGDVRISKDAIDKGITADVLLEMAAHVESISPHPIAKAIVESFRAASGREIDARRLALCENIPGGGARAMVDRKIVLVGSSKLMRDSSVELPEGAGDDGAGAIPVFVAVRGKYMGTIFVKDEPRRDASKMVDGLKKSGVSRVVVLTSCDSQIGQQARQAGVDEVVSEMAIDDKATKLQEYLEKKKQDESILYMGEAADTILIAHTDVGVALGSQSLSDAWDTAGVILPDGSLSQVAQAVDIAYQAASIGKQNKLVYIGVKTAAGVCTLLGWINPFWAVVVNIAVTAAVNLNATRLFQKHE